jgi:S1 domain
MTVCVQVRTNGFIVFVPKYGIEGPVYLAEKGAAADASWAMDEAKQLVTSPDNQTRCAARLLVLRVLCIAHCIMQCCMH